MVLTGGVGRNVTCVDVGRADGGVAVVVVDVGIWAGRGWKGM